MPSTEDTLTLALERLIKGLPDASARKARSFRPVSEVPIGELATHPDLGDRLCRIVRELPGAEVGIYYRMFAARTRAGRLFALAQGTGTLRLRVGADAVAASRQDGIGPGPEFGRDWIKVNAWNPKPRSDTWVAILEDLAKQAYDFAETSAV